MAISSGREEESAKGRPRKGFEREARSHKLTRSPREDPVKRIGVSTKGLLPANRRLAEGGFQPFETLTKLGHLLLVLRLQLFDFVE